MAAPSEGFWQRRGALGLYELLQSWWRHRVSFLLSLIITISALALYYLVFLQEKRTPLLEFVERLEGHDWPGNVRELANCLRRAVALAAGPEIGREALEGSAWAEAETAGRIKLTGDDVLRAGVSLENMERKLVEMTLAATGGNRSRAAELLGVSLRTVRNKVRDYGLPSWSSYVHD